MFDGRINIPQRELLRKTGITVLIVVKLKFIILKREINESARQRVYLHAYPMPKITSTNEFELNEICRAHLVLIQNGRNFNYQRECSRFLPI
jgi:hypothetical protein